MLRRFLPILVAGIVLGTMAPAAAIIPPDTQCRRGKVAITFDDGPSKANTPKLLRILRKHHAQATFFVQGQHAERYPSILRAAIRDGHAVENHSWDHPQLTLRPDRSVKRQLHLTQMAINRAIGQRPGLFRPPYGATSKRVRKMAKRYQLKQELWTIDSRDWSGISKKKIRDGAIKGLRPHRPNVILMHDAVTNSPTTLRAVPSIISGLRKRGYCLVPLEQMMPLGRVSARDVAVPESAASSTVVRAAFRLDGPSQRSGSFRVRSIGGSAVEGVDFTPVLRRLYVRRGQRVVTFRMRVRNDPMPNATRTLALRLDKARHLRLTSRSISIQITDDSVWDEQTSDLIQPSDPPAATLAP